MCVIKPTDLLGTLHPAWLEPPIHITFKCSTSHLGTSACKISPDSLFDSESAVKKKNFLKLSTVLRVLCRKYDLS